VAPLLSSPFCVEAATTDNALATCVECVMLMDGLWKWMAWLLFGCWLGFSARAGRSVVVVGVAWAPYKKTFVKYTKVISAPCASRGGAKLEGPPPQRVELFARGSEGPPP